MRKEKGKKYSKEDFIRDCRSNTDESVSGYSNIEEYINIATYLWDKWNDKKDGVVLMRMEESSSMAKNRSEGNEP